MYLKNISKVVCLLMIFTTIVSMHLVTSKSYVSAENLTISDGEVIKSDREIKSTFAFTSPINQEGTNGAMGVAIITDKGIDAIIASTSHGGIFDSSVQKNASDPSWHNHFVKLMAANSTGNKCGEDLMVEELTFEPPGNLTIANDTLDHSQLPTSFNATSSFSNASLSFELGDNIDKVVTFTLEPRINSSGDPEAICVTNVQPANNISISH